MTGKRVLIADDEIHIVHVVTIKLRNNGYEVITAENGAEAYDLACAVKPDVIITDPPRDGMNKKVVEQILAVSPEKIVYISCNSATQARDLSLMKDQYQVIKTQAVDMFPQTHHVENVVLLKRIEK